MEAAHCLVHADGATDTEPPHTYKCLARAVKVAEGRYKSQEPFVPSLPPPYLSLLHPITPPPPPFLRSSDLQPTILPLLSSKMPCMRNT